MGTETQRDETRTPTPAHNGNHAFITRAYTLAPSRDQFPSLYLEKHKRARSIGAVLADDVFGCHAVVFGL